MAEIGTAEDRPVGADLEFCVLGPLEVRRHGAALPTLPPMAAMLVAYLLIGRGGTRTVPAASTSSLVQALWSPGSADPSSATAVHQLVARLRRILDPVRQGRTADSVVRSAGQSYRLDIDPVRQLDLERFRGYVRQARQHLGDRPTVEIPQQEAASAVALLDAAEALWRGDFLADLPQTGWVANVTRAVETEREVAMELRLRARVAAPGDTTAVVPELIALHERRPDRSGPVGDLMVALHRAGRTAEALDVHARHRAHGRTPQALDVLADRIRRSRSDVRGTDPAELPHRGPGSSPGPMPVGPGPDTAFVGREEVFAAMDQAVRAARAGTGRLVLLKGPSGIGKTRAAREFLARAEPGVRTLFAGGWGALGSAPLLPWRRVLQWARTIASHDAPAAVSASLAALLGEGEEIADSDPVPRTATFHAAVDMLAAAARRRPLLIVLDDVHGMDEASGVLLDVLVGRLDEVGIVVVALCREPGAVASGTWHVVQARLETDYHVVVQRLTGLAVEDVRALAQLASGEAPPKASVDFLAARSAGQPLVLTLLLQGVVERGRFLGWPGAQARLGAMPENASQVLLGRMAGLSPAALSVLDIAAAASTAADEVDPYVLEEALDLRSDDLADALEILRSLGLIVAIGAGSEFVFAHAFYRDAVYAHLVGVRRERLHAGLGAAIERIHAPVPGVLRSQVAHHYQRGGHPVRAEAFRATVASARANTDRLAHEAAAAQFELAHDLADAAGDPPLQRADLLMLAAEAHTRAGRYRAARELCDRTHDLIGSADGVSAGRLLTRVALLFGAGLDFSLGNDEISRRNLELLHTARLRLDPDDVALRAQVLARLAAGRYWSAPEERALHSTERLAAADDALDLARRHADPGTLAHVLAAHSLAAWSPDTWDARRRAADEIVELGTRASDVEAVLAGLRWALICAAEAGDIAAVDQAIDRYQRTASGLRQPVHEYWVEVWRGMRALLDGRYPEAQERALRAHSLSTPLESDDVERQNGVGALSQAILYDLGRAADFEPVLLDYVARYPQVPAWRLGLALTAVERNNLEVAAALYKNGWPGVTALPRDAIWLYALTCAAEVVGRLGDRDLAATLYDLLRPYETRCAVASYGFVWGGPIALPLARLARIRGDRTTGHRHLTVARDMAERSGSVPFRARVAHETFLQLRHSGDPAGRAAASAAWEEATRLSGSIGMHGLVARLTADRM